MKSENQILDKSEIICYLLKRYVGLCMNPPKDIAQSQRQDKFEKPPQVGRFPYLYTIDEIVGNEDNPSFLDRIIRATVPGGVLPLHHPPSDDTVREYVYTILLNAGFHAFILPTKTYFGLYIQTPLYQKAWAKKEQLNRISIINQ